MANMPGSSEEDAQVKVQILAKYPRESEDLTLSPLCDTSHGEVDDEVVEFSYRVERRDYHHTGETLDCLSWKRNTSNGVEDVVVVAVKYIVGIHTIGGRLSNEYSLIYLDPLADCANPEPLNVVLRITTVVDPPDDLLGDFTCPEEPDHLSVPATETTPNLYIILPADASSVSKAWGGILQPLLDHFQLVPDEDYSLHRPTSAHSITDMVTSTVLPRATQGIAQTILLIGNDQGVGEILNALLSTSPFAGPPEGIPITFSPSLHPSDYIKPILAILPWGGNNAIAHSNYITSEGWSNRITKHSTLGLRALLRGQPNPLPLFRVTFSRGACLLTDNGRRRIPLRNAASEVTHSGTEQRADETVSILHGAVIASWGQRLYPTGDYGLDADQPSTSDFSATTAETASTGTSDKGPAGPVRGQVTLFEASKNTTCRNGSIMSGSSNEVFEIPRREHSCVIATCCEFLDESFIVSPDCLCGGTDLKVVEFGPIDASGNIGQDQADNISDATAKQRFDPHAATDETWEILRDVAQSGRHAKDRRVGYWDIQGMRIELDPEEDNEMQRQFCVDGNIIVVEKGGWMEVRTGNFGTEGVLDLIAYEWEGSEVSVGELGNIY